MCTLTIYRALNPNSVQSVAYGAMMNRDERYEREEGDVFTADGLYYPTDDLSGGTWSGTNRAGLMLFLLNRYELTATSGTSSSVSRGSIIPFLLRKARTVSEALTRLNSLPLLDMAPFTLILQDSTCVWRWDWTGIMGSGLDECNATEAGIESFCLFDQSAGRCSSDQWPASWHDSTSAMTLNHQYNHEEEGDVMLWMLSSSSVETQRILRFRQQLFYTFWQGNGFNLDRLCQFHQTQPQGLESESVCMARPKTHTKSWTYFHCALKARRIENTVFEYLPLSDVCVIDGEMKTFTPWLRMKEVNHCPLP